VIRGIRNKQEPRDVFDVVQEGVRPCLILEVVSPKYEEVRRNDYVKKKEIYERVGIPEYLIVEPYRIPGSPIRQWTGYRLGFDGRYQRIEPDGEGRLLSETTGLLFGIAEDGGFQVTDARTGERLLNQSQLAAAREAAEEAQKAAEERATWEAERAGIPEYVILEPTLTWEDHILLMGYRLDSAGRYQPIEPNTEGRPLSETTGLLFGEDEDGSVLVVEARTGARLRKPTQIEEDEEAAQKRAVREARRAAREAERADREAEARKAAEAEIARLRAELKQR